MARNLLKAKPKKKSVAPIRRRFGVAGAPDTDNWNEWEAYFRLEVERKDLAAVVRNHIRTHYKEEAKTLLNAPDYMYYMYAHIPASMLWAEKSKPFPEKYDYEKSINGYIEKLRTESARKQEEAENGQTKTSVSPAELTQRKTNSFLAEVDSAIDNYPAKYSLYSELTKITAAHVTAKQVYEMLLPIYEEIKELVSLSKSRKNDMQQQLEEGYSHMNTKERKAYLAFLSEMVDDAKRYMQKKKALRVSKPRVRTADKQVAKVNYLKESTDFKVSSINPMMIVGAKRLFTFNVRYRQLSEYVSNSGMGFEVKGTTVQNIDSENSSTVILRKPLDILPTVLGKSLRDIHKDMAKIKTKRTEATGRINKDTIILRVMDK
jgi:hypothetical protein